MKRSRRMMESDSVILSSNLGIVFYCETSPLLSTMQKNVIRTNINQVRKGESVERVMEIVDFINQIYPQLEETRFREICQTTKGQSERIRELEWERKWIQWNKERDMEFLGFCYSKLLMPEQPGLELLSLVLRASFDGTVNLFLGVCKKMRCAILQNAPLLTDLFSRTDTALWISRKYFLSAPIIVSKLSPLLLVLLIDMDTKYRMARESFLRYSAMNHFTIHKTFITRSCSTWACQCKECHYEKFLRISPLDKQSRSSEDPSYMEKRAALIKSRSNLSRFVYNHFRFSL